MRILEQCNNNLRISKVMLDMSFLKAKKYGMKQLTADKDDIAQMDSTDLVSEYKIKKLYADRSYINEVIGPLYKELCLNKCFTGLNKSVEDMIARNHKIVNLKEIENNNRMRAKDLYKQLRQQRNRFKIEIYENQMMIYTMQTKIKESKLYTDIRDRYVDYWEDSRTEQHDQILSSIENKQFDALEHYKYKFNDEYRTHAALDKFLNQVIHEIHEKIDAQIEKHERDIEAMDLNIQIKRHAYLSTYEDRIRLQKMLIKHDENIKKWIHFKEERQRARIYSEKMYNSACTIQAWWRGLLVRLKLGPYTIKTKKIRRG